MRYGRRARLHQKFLTRTSTRRSGAPLAPRAAATPVAAALPARAPATMVPALKQHASRTAAFHSHPTCRHGLACSVVSATSLNLSPTGLGSSSSELSGSRAGRPRPLIVMPCFSSPSLTTRLPVRERVCGLTVSPSSLLCHGECCAMGIMIIGKRVGCTGTWVHVVVRASTAPPADRLRSMRASHRFGVGIAAVRHSCPSIHHASTAHWHALPCRRPPGRPIGPQHTETAYRVLIVQPAY